MSVKEFRTRFGRLLLGDARELIRDIPSGSIDIVITDPPYGLGMDEYDDPQVFFDIEDELYRVMRDDSYLIFFYSIKNIGEVFRRIRRFRYVWMIPVINISYGRMTHSSIGFNQVSIILVYAKGKPKPVIRSMDYIYVIDELPYILDKEEINTMRRMKALRQFKNTMTIAHLIRRFVDKEYTVLDPFVGYGSIPLTCELLGVKWIGFEIDEQKYMFTKKALEKIMRRQ